jgi:2-succinyl-5-enolpyruvyl-6-hydroxy-3-cyclohexene-1-carboxylate synthase
MQPSPADHAHCLHAATASFFACLAANGVELVVISPGSRSAPLALAADRTPGLRSEVVVDERSAAFVALGAARASRRPVALVCTSGTAAANYLPAVVEASHGGVPLLVNTADRPPELRMFGAGQTVDQIGLYGRAVRWFHELPVGSDLAPAHASLLAARAVALATAERGPVHLNWPFREPLEPPAEAPLLAAPVRVAGAAVVGDPSPLVAAVRSTTDGVVAVGPAMYDPPTAQAIAGFAASAGWPLLADPASGLRTGGAALGMVASADLLLGTPGFADQQRPLATVRFGPPLTSKPYRLWLEQHRPSTSVVVDPGPLDWADPSDLTSIVVAGEPGPLAAGAAGALERPPASPWLDTWTAADKAAAAVLTARATGDDEITMVRALAELPAGAILVASSSMPIRDLDIALCARVEPLRVLANRGANGIDGVVSTAVGVAMVSAEPVVVFVGDLATLHDLGGLVTAARAGARLVVVIPDNDGGGIFSFLPVASAVDEATFRRLFHTPHGLDLVAIAAALGATAERVHAPQLPAALAAALERDGSSVLVVPLDAAANRRAFADLRGQVAAALA